jgi:hypothetical protein
MISLSGTGAQAATPGDAAWSEILAIELMAIEFPSLHFRSTTGRRPGTSRRF